MKTKPLENAQSASLPDEYIWIDDSIQAPAIPSSQNVDAENCGGSVIGQENSIRHMKVTRKKPNIRDTSDAYEMPELSHEDDNGDDNQAGNDERGGGITTRTTWYQTILIICCTGLIQAGMSVGMYFAGEYNFGNHISIS